MPFYSSSAAFCLLRSHHVLLFRLVASDRLSCLAVFGHSLSSLLLSLSLCPCHRILPSSSVLLFCSQSFLLFFATRQLLSDIEELGCGYHTRPPKPISVSCVCKGAEARTSLSVRQTDDDARYALQVQQGQPTMMECRGWEKTSTCIHIVNSH